MVRYFGSDNPPISWGDFLQKKPVKGKPGLISIRMYKGQAPGPTHPGNCALITGSLELCYLIFNYNWYPIWGLHFKPIFGDMRYCKTYEECVLYDAASRRAFASYLWGIIANTMMYFLWAFKLSLLLFIIIIITQHGH